ncbi:short-subunit dehydrogenase [Streptococcus gallinaceus]|uniref:SDR family NAD(P)-dependent oxidoreductase n=1 Tax=Streptococcus gallinaceus TaxID=165758 RepID=UPI0020A108A2|nr:SDR family oxidoreductase [Streptococcus gallinaceus]MCP1638662.1 short-subunit dehydrogenase [Streptococcus gallinaceus]MCP1769251.1 short-subunit dehydrogenase [Streptococcus gallinaceus]
MRKILITGASGGIAQEIVKLLPDDFLILLGRDRQKLDHIYAFHANKAIFSLDICDEKAVAELIAHIYQEFGQIDILINNAGYGLYNDFEQFTAQEVQDMFAVNTFATMTFCREVGKRMKAIRAGHIINIVSMSGLVASAKSSVYSATKFALIGFSNTIRLELAAYQVAVTTVNPGPVATPFFDLADPDGSYQESVKAFTLQPQVVAKQIVKAMKTRKREINLPFSLAATSKFYSLFPILADYLARTVFNYK